MKTELMLKTKIPFPFVSFFLFFLVPDGAETNQMITLTTKKIMLCRLDTS